jgi:MerR family transcriptional regulator, copper efflux regulator
MQIGTAARYLGTSVRAIRRYEEMELVPQFSRTSNGYRNINKTELSTMYFIVRARKSGVSYRDIKKILLMLEPDNNQKQDIVVEIQNMISAIDGKSKDLHAMKRALANFSNADNSSIPPYPF